jgi:hypothetical protein
VERGDDRLYDRVMRRPSDDTFLEPAEAVARVRRWTENPEGLRPLLASLPPGATLKDALRRHRALRQVGRRPSSCMASEPDA